MRIVAVTVFCLLGLLLALPAPASAARYALGDQAAQARQAASAVTDAGWRRRAARKCARGYRCGNWTATPYWRPYYYYHWQQYYPYGGPLF